MNYWLVVKRKRISNSTLSKKLTKNLVTFACYSGLLLNSIMASFKPNYIAHRAVQFVSIISNSATEGITKAQLFRSLGMCLSQCPPPSDQKLSVLNGSWKTISTFTHVAEYIPCVEPWAQYTAKNFDVIY